MDQTARLGFPLMVAGQGQKEMTHNEALLLLDSAVAAVAERRDLTVPPTSPADGQCWLIPPGATDAWAGRDGDLAVWTAGGWRYLTFPEGASLFVRADGATVRRVEGSWQQAAPFGAPAAAVEPPQGGTVVDVEARSTLGQLLDRMRTLGLIEP